MEVNCSCETTGEYQREYYIEMAAVSIFLFSTMILLCNFVDTYTYTHTHIFASI